MSKGWMLAAMMIVAITAAPSDGQPIADEPVYLEQGWTDGQRNSFYVGLEPGIWIMPYDWFESLELPGSTADNVKMLKDASVFKQYRLILDPNPNLRNELPIGFIKSALPIQKPFPSPLLTGVHYIGQTCALCHTGQLVYKEKAYRVDGGSGMLDLLGFGQLIQASLMKTREVEKLNRFAERLTKRDPTPEEKAEIAKALGILLAFMDTISPLPENDPAKLGQLLRLYPFAWGYGRGDALGRGGNTLLAPLVKHDDKHPLGNLNRIPATAPVSTPHLWYSPQYDWVEWNGSIQNPMGRNIAQAITTGPRLSFKDPLKPYQSDVNLDVLYDLENVVVKLTAPRWPAGFPFEPKRVANGKKLYVQLCAQCHVPASMTENKFKQRYAMYKKSMTPLSIIGTDPIMASNFYSRKVTTGAIEQRPDGSREKAIVSAADGMQLITSGMMEAQGWFKTPREPNEWRAPLAYIARLNAGIWATPPFLHNGSVPTLYALLSPKEERPSHFCVGRLEFDPFYIGYQSELQDCQNGLFVFDTALPGNSNAGHEFRKLAGYEKQSLARAGRIGRYLKPEERKDLIEYMKTCDLEYSAEKGWLNAPARICGLVPVPRTEP